MMIINSRFKVHKILGKGRSQVYLVEDLKLSNRNYALKIVDLKNLTDEEISALKIEFRLLNKINHPNIVQAYEFDKVYECDKEEFIGSYFFISEFIDGKNLLEFFKSPLNLNEIDEFLLVLNQICTTLYYIHQLGIIHFDIRPENILIEHNNSNQLNIKFIDFGFSTLKAKQIRGTPLYISPELISGKEVDFRTDLYSLGATLYHVIAGKPPFETESELDLLKKHIEENPPELPKSIPKFLRDIIKKLLEKNPADRFRNSLEILSYLPKKFQSFNRIWYIPKTYSARTDELNELIDYINSEGSSEVAFIFSESGMGKTYLLKELLVRLEDEKKFFIYLSYSQENSTSYGLFFDLINQITRLTCERKFLNETEILEKLKYLKQYYFELDKPLDFQENQQSILSELLISIAKELKYVIVIDDLDKFDTSSQKFFYFVYPSLVDLGIKIIVAVNTKFIKSGEISKISKIKTVVLLPLSKIEILKLLASYFKFDFPYNEVADLLIDYTDKSVKEINEFLSGLLISEILTFDSKGFKLNHKKIRRAELENLVAKTYDYRIENLSHNQKLILEILSLIDFPLNLKQLSEISELDELTLKKEIDYLELLGWIEYSSRLDNVSFPKSGIKKYLSRKTQEDKKLNLKLAQFLSYANFASNIVAEFYERANEISKALEYYEKAAQEAENYFAFSLMEKYLLKAISLEKDSQKNVYLKYKLALSYFYQSEFQKLLSLINTMNDEEHLNLEQRFKKNLIHAIALSKTGNIDDAYEYFDKAFKLADTNQQKIEVELNQINLEISQGNFMIAMKQCENLLNEYKDILTEEIVAALFNNLGITNSQLGNFSKATEYFENAFQIYSKKKDKLKSSQVLMNLGNVYSILGDNEKSLNYWNEALKINDTIGDISKKALILNNIGISLFENFELDEAIKKYEEALELFEKINDSFGKNLSLLNLAEALFILCDYDKSLECLEESLNLSKRLIDIEGECQSLFLLGLNYLNLNQMQKAEEICFQLLSAVESHRLQSTHLQYYLYLSGLLDFENRKIDEAETKLELSNELLKNFDGKYFYCKNSIDLMRIYAYQGKFDSIKLLKSILEENSYYKKNDLLKAEVYLVLGEVSKKPGSNLNENPIYYYNEAINYLKHSYINEITWQVLLAAGEEYLFRGAVAKGLELMKQSKMIFDFLASKIQKLENKNSYLAQVKRARAIEKFEKVLNNF